MCLELAVLRDMKNKALLRLIHFIIFTHMQNNGQRTDENFIMYRSHIKEREM